MHRIADAEISIDVVIKDRLGACEHQYDVADIDGVNGKYYIPIGFSVAAAEPRPELESDDQHTEFQIFKQPIEDAFAAELHPYVQTYLVDAGIIESI